MSALLTALQRGRTDAVAAPKKVGRPKKEPAAPVPLPEASADGAPDEDDYRVDAAEVDEAVCLGRRFSDPDKRWKPAIYRELQCGGAVKEDGLCETCARRLQKYAADPKPGPWLGLITEEPPGWCHMLGTDWALDKNPVWRGVDTGSATASETGSESGGSSQMRTAAAQREAKKAEKEVERAAKKAGKEEEKAAKKAAKEEEKAAKKAAKEAEKEAKKAEKEAEKAAKKTTAPKKTAAAPKKTSTGSNAAGGGPVAAATESAVAEAVELKMIDGSLYMVKKGNVYEYDEITEKTGDFVGRLNADGDSIDTDAEEEGAAESDSD